MYIPAALVFVGLWSGIPTGLVLRRQDRDPKPHVVPALQRSEQPAGA